VKIKQASFNTRATRIEEFPASNHPEVAFLGRSNVGKSSLLNALLGRKNLARTSSIPGKTRAVHFYLVNHSFFLVDLPGYGYAKVSKQERLSWGPLMEKYFSTRHQLQLSVHIVDIRHPPTELDFMMAEWLLFYRKPFITVATKADKISRGRRPKHIKTLREGLKLPPEQPIIAFSAVDKSGVEEIWEWIETIFT